MNASGRLNMQACHLDYRVEAGRRLFEETLSIDVGD